MQSGNKLQHLLNVGRVVHLPLRTWKAQLQLRKEPIEIGWRSWGGQEISEVERPRHPMNSNAMLPHKLLAKEIADLKMLIASNS